MLAVVGGGRGVHRLWAGWACACVVGCVSGQAASPAGPAGLRGPTRFGSRRAEGERRAGPVQPAGRLLDDDECLDPEAGGGGGGADRRARGGRGRFPGGRVRQRLTQSESQFPSSGWVGPFVAPAARGALHILAAREEHGPVRAARRYG